MVSASDVERVLRLLQNGAATAADVLGARSGADGRLSTETARAERAYRKELARYQRGVERDRAQVWWAGTGAVVCTAAAVPTGGVSLVGTAAFGWLATSSLVRLRTRRPPAQPDPPLPAVPRLTRAAVGAGEVERLARAERRLAEVAPAIERLHPGAAVELRAAAQEATPLLHQQAHRLAVLHGVRSDLAGSPAGAAADAAARDVADRLDRGVTAYEGLLAAAATLLGAPDVARDVDDVLAPAVQALQSYAHGLTVSAEPPQEPGSGSGRR
jgi:hypothetical protein